MQHIFCGLVQDHKISRLFFKRISIIQPEQFALDSTQPLTAKILTFPRIVTLATTSVLGLKPSFMTGW